MTGRPVIVHLIGYPGAGKYTVAQHLARLAAELAVARQSPYVPVRLVCARDEILRRVPNADRRERLKWIDPGAVGAFIDEHELIELDGHPLLQVDVTARPPDGTARHILAHIDSLD